MSSILKALTSGFFERDLCASDDCITTAQGGNGVVAPLFDIAVGKLL